MSSIVDTPLSHLPQPKSGWQLFKSLASGKSRPGLRGKTRPIDVNLCYVRWRHRSAPLACWQAWQNNRA
jgi:hypothetical protein